MYDFMNFTERLPREFFTHLVRKHLEEDSNNKPILNSRRKSCDKLSLESPVIRSIGSNMFDNFTDKASLKQKISKSSDSSILSRQQAIQLETFLREDIDRKLD